MNTEVGRITGVFRYPVKSMAGLALNTANLGWHGVDGDRRFAFRRTADRSGFPFLTASRLPELILYEPFGHAEADELIPTHIRTPDGRVLDLNGEELQEELSQRHGSGVQLMHLKAGIFDEASVSVISLATIRQVESESGRPLDIRRFRPNIIVETFSNAPFGEDSWIGSSLAFGTEFEGPAVSVTIRDKRCVMINLDPETAEADARVMKAAVRLNGNNAGVYGTVIRTGEVSIGQSVFLRRE
ncbi:MAG TPA: MOSC domain-containing protein [Blastocatellia bacterium]|nr:MOSC domain-containing protein [Blastocatellia bacterium]